jgi:hypothetical protein
MINKNIMNSLSNNPMSKGGLYDNYNLGREYDLMDIKDEKKGKMFNQNKIEILNDRDLFSKVSNAMEDIDMSSNNFADNFGMPSFQGQIFKNKKSLIRTPYIQEHNNKTNFVSNNSDVHDSFAKIGSEKSSARGIDSLTAMGYNGNGNDDKDDKCKIEQDILGFEYDINMNKNKEFIFDINSPFALAYLWKSLIILTKNPTTSKILESMNISKKETVANDLKHYAEIFEDLGTIRLDIPVLNSQMDTNTKNKIYDLYKIDINMIEDVRNYDELDNAEIYLKYNFSLEIPLIYQPNIIYGFFDHYKKSQTKFIEMSNVLCSLIIHEKRDFVNIEIPMGSHLTLGFLYNTDKKMLDEIDYDFIVSKKIPKTLIKSLTIPKINRNKKSEYSKNFKDILSNVHFGDISYGKMYDTSIKIDMTLDVESTKEIPDNNHRIENKIEKININHACYFYIKHNNVQNRIFMNGFINY